MALGVDFASRGRRTDECIEVLRTVWRDRVASYHGDHIRFDDIKLTTYPVQPSIPIVVGGMVVFVLADAGRRIYQRVKGGAHA